MTLLMITSDVKHERIVNISKSSRQHTKAIYSFNAVHQPSINIIMSQSIENKVIIDGQTCYGGLNQPNLKFIKVNVDCWEKIFDFLSLCDILAMSQTCQRMRQIGGHYFRENFRGTVCTLHELSGLYISIDDNPVERDDFLRFIDTVRIRNKLEPLRTVSNMGLLSSLTTLRLYDIILNEHKLHGLENIQTDIETIDLSYCDIDDDSFSTFLASCTNLKSLCLNWVDFKSRITMASLFQKTYPMLERFEYTSPEEMTQLMTFLKLNQSIKCLRIEARDLREIPLDVSVVRLDCLYIDTYRWLSDANEVLYRLKTLHANGFFKTLRLSIARSPDGFDHDLFIREMISFSPIEMLSTYEFYTNAMCQLTQLKELYLWGLDHEINLESMAMNLVNLERFRIDGTIHQLLPFLRHSNKLKFVIFGDKNSFFYALNVNELNEVRRMGGMKRKVRIGVYEDKYLTTKWTEKIVNYDLIEITRKETIRKYFYYE